MDRRQRKTRAAIFAAFEELMASEHYSQVTVAQIIERADIGRSTFYAHFETKDELTSAMCTEMFDHIFEGVNQDCITHATLATPGLEGMLAHLLYHLRDTHAGVAAKLLAEGEPHFTAQFRTRLAELIASDPPALPTDAPADLTETLLVSSFCEAVAWWNSMGRRTPPEQLARWYLLPLT